MSDPVYRITEVDQTVASILAAEVSTGARLLDDLRVAEAALVTAEAALRAAKERVAVLRGRHDRSRDFAREIWDQLKADMMSEQRRLPDPPEVLEEKR